MEIKTRKQAMLDGENTYFTGKPCKHGHMNYRYVQSGSCYDCINGDRIVGNSPTAIAREARLKASAEALRERERDAAIVQQARLARVNAKNSLVQVKLYCRDADLELFEATAYAFAVMRFPELLPSDVWPGIIHAKYDGGALYKVNAHVDDVEALRDLDRSLQAAARPDRLAVATKLHGAYNASVLTALPAPDWSIQG